MRRLFERLVRAWPLQPACRRALDETLADWKHEDESASSSLQRWMSGVRSAVSVVRALLLVAWWSPKPLAQPYRASGPQSAKDEILNLISGLSPDSSYEDILRELAARRKAGEQPPEAGPPEAPKKARSVWSDAAFRRRALLIAGSYVVIGILAGLIQSWLTTPAYRSTAQVRAEPDVRQITVLAAGQQALPMLDPESFMQTELSVLQSRDLKRRVMQKLRLDENEERAIETLTANLEISVQQVSHLFTIDVSSSTPQVAALVANTLATEYRDQNLAARQATVRDRLAKLDEFVKTLSAEIDVDRRSLIATTSAAGVLDPEVVNRNVTSAQGELTSKTIALQDAQTKANEMGALDPDKDFEKAMSHPEILSATAPQRSQLNMLRTRRLGLVRQGLADNHPLLQQVDVGIAAVTDNIRNEIRRRIETVELAVRNAAAQRDTAQRFYDAQRNLQLENSKAGIPYIALRQRLASNEKTLEELQKQQKDLQILEKGVDNNVTIVEYAQPASRPYKPNVRRNVLVWLTFGLAAVVMTVAYSSARRARRVRSDGRTAPA